MDKLLKLEKYQLLHNSIYWCGMIGIFILGFFTADTYVTEVMGPTEEIVSSLADIFNGMVYDSTFLLIIMSAILALILGQEFSKRTINLEVSAGHSRKQIFTSKIISYLIAFNLMALVYPVSGCIREFGRFGVADVGMFFYNIIKAIIYSSITFSAVGCSITFLSASDCLLLGILTSFYLLSNRSAIEIELPCQCCCFLVKSRVSLP